MKRTFYGMADALFHFTGGIPNGAVFNRSK